MLTNTIICSHDVALKGLHRNTHFKFLIRNINSVSLFTEHYEPLLNVMAVFCNGHEVSQKLNNFTVSQTIVD